MNEEEARSVYLQFCNQSGRTSRSARAERRPDGSWRFIEVEDQNRLGDYFGVVVRQDGHAFPFGGALGKVLRNTPGLGEPKSLELFLGATEFGRYQQFENGIGIWEGGVDAGFAVVESMVQLPSQLCAVAFFDLRGFTSWAQRARPDDVQQTIGIFEDVVHIGFPVTNTLWSRLFVKGTGDGVMIVSQADWYKNAVPNDKRDTLASGHARDFLDACDRSVKAWQQQFGFRFPLAIGCGIGSGELHRVFLFGRLDFIGPAANEAAKLQQHAWNEICVTPTFADALRKDGRVFGEGDRELPAKGWRLHSR